MSNSAHDTTVVDPVSVPFAGSVRVPGDKSISHRAVLFSAMAQGVSRLSGVLDSADVRSTIEAVRALGAKVALQKQADGSLAGSVEGWGAAGPVQPGGAIDCGNSGTTTRLLMGVLAPWDVRVKLTGDESLCRRPMRRIAAPLESMGATFLPEGVQTLPLTICGTRELRALSYSSPVASAQLKTALLLAGTQACGTTEVTEPAPSRNHTELMLPAFGVPVSVCGLTAKVDGPCTLRASDVDVPGDPSSAAFIVCAAALKSESKVVVENVSLNPARIGFARVLERMGADVSVSAMSSQGAEPCGNLSVCYRPQLHACEVSPEEIASLIDEIPVLALVAATASGTTVFRGAGELRVKETDRFQAIIDGLSLLGVRAWGQGDDLFVEGHAFSRQGGIAVKPGTVFDSLGDHRLAMTWSLVGMVGSAPVRVRRIESVNISYPQFFEDMGKLAKEK